MNESESQSEEEYSTLSQSAALLEKKSAQQQKFAEQYKSRWRSIRVSYFTMFINAVATTIVYSSLWPYLKMMDVETTTWYLGLVHVAFNLAELGCIILFGAWVQYRSGFEPLTFSLVCLIIGNLLYAWALSFGYYGKFVVLVARLIIGCATGNDVVVTAEVCANTTIKERSGVIAYCSLAQALGFMLGPAIQAALVPVGSKGVFVKIFWLHINFCTLAGLVTVLFAAANLIAIWIHGKTDYRIDNPYIDTDTDECPSETKEEKLGEKAESKGIKAKLGFENAPDLLAVAVVLTVFFVARHVLVFLEVMFPPMAMDQYALSDADTVLYIGLILSISGFCSTFIFVGIEKVTAMIGDRIPIVISSFLMLAGFLVLWPISNQYPVLGHFYTELVNTTSGVERVTRLTPGCSPTHSWCKSTPRVSVTQFIISIVLVTLAFPISYALLPSLFSKVIPPGKQGIMVSLFSVSGNLSRIFGPAAFTTLYSYYGPKLLFGIMDVGLFISLLLTIFFYKRLIPYKLYRRKKKEKRLM